MEHDFEQVFSHIEAVVMALQRFYSKHPQTGPYNEILQGGTDSIFETSHVRLFIQLIVGVLMEWDAQGIWFSATESMDKETREYIFQQISTVTEFEKKDDTRSKMALTLGDSSDMSLGSARKRSRNADSMER